MDRDDIIKATHKYMKGNWQFKDDKIAIELKISQQIVSLIFNGHREEFDGNAHWFGNYLMFLQNQYYVRTADEKHLIFGKNKPTPLVGDIEWEYRFDRIN
jgi:hypothetical protein